MIGQLVGFLLAIYFLAGRWTFARLEGDYELVPIAQQPRLWIAVALVAIAFIIQNSARQVARRLRPTNVDAAILVFLAYMLISATWGPDAPLACMKAFEVALLLTVAAVIAFSRTGGPEGQLNHGFWGTLVVIGIGLGSLALLYTTSGRAYAPGGGPNTFGRNMGLMAIGALFLASRYGLTARAASVGIVATAALLIVLCGSRGGLLSFSIAAATYVVTAKTSIAKKTSIIAAMAAATFLALSYTNAGREAVEVFHGRIIEQTIGNRHLAGREDLWLQAWEMMCDRPIFGWGLNGFRANSWNYPHNIFMEVTVEGGLVGLLLLLNILAAWWRQVRRCGLRVSRPHLAALALTVTAAQTSGDLFDSRGIFLILALSTPLAITARRPWSSVILPAPQGAGIARAGRGKLPVQPLALSPRRR